MGGCVDKSVNGWKEGGREAEYGGDAKIEG